ncbi:MULTISPECIES: hypothetical protein [unclassified Stenotrophomonas]|uniref:hypothetical protein n=1 Tax=unclassified Stenotrophomonas TaxID=196198 RepID=UPI00278AF884|nr:MULTISPECIES: hypothetical protein [unclassified Stenotrophomonas]MDQ1063495.1 hypothetical protein [Stenotrophomonas sp. SORGH_AS_0282]MDQ1188144.1 hypothetical protein [Stenotrophomonas sp. SORGH_AS_0282]MDY0981430.1 hypothetical protein [Stenotrophomonas sp. CFBP8994]
MKSTFLSCVFLLALPGCGEGPPTDDRYLSPRQLAVVTAAAKDDDLVAIKRLIAHYEATPGNDVPAARWRQRARDLGDVQELYYQAASRFASARVAESAEARFRLLAEAQDAAKRAYERAPEHANLLLVEQIEREMRTALTE